MDSARSQGCVKATSAASANIFLSLEESPVALEGNSPL